jgi:hypothetical protein
MAPKNISRLSLKLPLSMDGGLAAWGVVDGGAARQPAGGLWG